MSSSALRSMPVSIPDPFVAPLRDLEALVQRIAAATGESELQVRSRLAREQADCGANVREALRAEQIAPYIWSERLVQFYESTDAFLYETVVWNRTQTKNRIRHWIARRLALGKRPLSILTYGDGLGFDSLYLALAGHRVSYYEVSSRSIAFARRMFDEQGADIEVLTSTEEWVGKRFDAIVCLDVLEHIPQPQRLVASLAEALKPDGQFIVHAPFWYLHPNVGTHLRANRKFSGDLRQLYTRQGLQAVGADWLWNPLALKKAVPNRIDSVPLTARLQLLVGGMLLKIARWWPFPFIVVARGLGRRFFPDRGR